MANEVGKSRVEAILENILGAENEILEPVSRNETLLQALSEQLEDTPNEVVSSDEINAIVNSIS